MQSYSSVYKFFATIFRYPSQDFFETFTASLKFLPPLIPGQELADEFLEWAKNTPLEEVQELYTRTFDLQVVCYPYVGYQLFGESYKRGLFMATLKGHYRDRNFSEGGELPDHLSVLLDYLAHLEEIGDGIEKEIILEDGLLPALEKMVNSFEGNPYKKALSALQLTLESISTEGKLSRQFSV